MSDQWAVSIPELQTRPASVEVMRSDRRLRQQFERIHHDLMGVATRMKDHRCAAEVLTLLWRHRIEDFTARWRGRIDNETFNEIHGALRNIFHNAMTRATGRTAPLRPMDIER